MRRPGDTAAGLLAWGSCQCRLTIFVVEVGPEGCGGVSSGAFATSITGFGAIRSRAYAMSSLSDLVKVSDEKISATVVCAGEGLALAGGVGVPALRATIAPRPIKQTTASHTVLITANPASSEHARIECEHRTESGA